MGEKLKNGDYGRFIFTQTKKCFGRAVSISFDIEGAEVTDIDNGHVFLKGSDGAVYIPAKKSIKSFERMTKEIK